MLNMILIHLRKGTRQSKIVYSQIPQCGVSVSDQDGIPRFPAVMPVCKSRMVFPDFSVRCQCVRTRWYSQFSQCGTSVSDQDGIPRFSGVMPVCKSRMVFPDFLVRCQCVRARRYSQFSPVRCQCVRARRYSQFSQCGTSVSDQGGNPRFPGVMPVCKSRMVFPRFPSAVPVCQSKTVFPVFPVRCQCVRKDDILSFPSVVPVCQSKTVFSVFPVRCQCVRTRRYSQFSQCDASVSEQE